MTSPDATKIREALTNSSVSISEQFKHAYNVGKFNGKNPTSKRSISYEINTAESVVFNDSFSSISPYIQGFEAFAVRLYAALKDITPAITHGHKKEETVLSTSNKKAKKDTLLPSQLLPWIQEKLDSSESNP